MRFPATVGGPRARAGARRSSRPSSRAVNRARAADRLPGLDIFPRMAAPWALSASDTRPAPRDHRPRWPMMIYLIGEFERGVAAPARIKDGVLHRQPAPRPRRFVVRDDKNVVRYAEPLHR